MERKGLIEKRGGEKDWTKMKIYIAMYRRAVHRVPGTCLSAVLFEEGILERDTDKGHLEKGEERVEGVATTRARAVFHEGILISLHEQSYPSAPIQMEGEEGGGLCNALHEYFHSCAIRGRKKKEKDRISILRSRSSFEFFENF